MPSSPSHRHRVTHARSASRLALLLLAVGVLPVPRAAAQTFTLTNGNSMVQIDPHSANGVLGWTVDGVSQMHQQWYWLRVGSGAEVPLSALTFIAGSQMFPSSVRFDYSGFFGAVGLQIDLTYTLVGGSPGTRASQLLETIHISAPLERSDVVVSVFRYADLDLANTSAFDLAAWQPPATISQSDGSTTVEAVASPDPTHFALGLFPSILSSLSDGGPTVLGDAPTSLGPGNLTYAVQWDLPLPSRATATANHSTRFLTPPADVSVTKTDGHAAAMAGQPITYTIVAANAGPTAVTGANVTDTVPAALLGAAWTCAGANGGNCSPAGSAAINDTVDLPVGASVTYTLSGTISGAATGNLTNTASIALPAGVIDPVPANNSATDTDALVTLGGSNDTPASATYVPIGATSADTLGGPPDDQNWFRYHVIAGRSYCVEVDNGRTEQSIRDTVLAVFRADASTLVGSNDNIADEPGASLLSRVCAIATLSEDNLARVTAGGSGTGGGFRVRVVETTLFCPWLGPLSIGSVFESFVLIKNTTGTVHNATVALAGPTGTPVGAPQSGSAPANGSYNLQVSSAPPTGFGLSGVAAGVIIAHDGPPGALIANVTTLNFASGVSYDTPAVPRLDPR